MCHNANVLYNLLWSDILTTKRFDLPMQIHASNAKSLFSLDDKTGHSSLSHFAEMMSYKMQHSQRTGRSARLPPCQLSAARCKSGAQQRLPQTRRAAVLEASAPASLASSEADASLELRVRDACCPEELMARAAAVPQRAPHVRLARIFSAQRMLYLPAQPAAPPPAGGRVAARESVLRRFGGAAGAPLPEALPAHLPAGVPGARVRLPVRAHAAAERQEPGVPLPGVPGRGRRRAGLPGAQPAPQSHQPPASSATGRWLSPPRRVPRGGAKPRPAARRT